MENDLVSVIIPTRNSSRTIRDCLFSVKNQLYKNIEIVVVDNNSTDDTYKIAREFTGNVYLNGPERSAQRNFGVSKSHGKYLLFIDSDMVLSENVVRRCVEVISTDKDIGGIIINEESFGTGFITKCKIWERSFYSGIDWIESARFFDKKIFDLTHGYNEEMIWSEDIDLSNRVRSISKIVRIPELIYHDEGELTLRKVFKKTFYYSKNSFRFINNNFRVDRNLKHINPLYRLGLFFTKPKRMAKNPLIFTCVILIKMADFIIGGAGYILSFLNNKSTHN